MAFPEQAPKWYQPWGATMRLAKLRLRDDDFCLTFPGVGGTTRPLLVCLGESIAPLATSLSARLRPGIFKGVGLRAGAILVAKWEQ